MADYATTTEIELEMNTDFEADTKVTNDGVARFITEATAQINAEIVDIYQTPVDANASPQAFSILKKICIDFVVWRVAKILSVKEGESLPDGRVSQQVTTGAAFRESQKNLFRIKQSAMSLPDAVQLSGNDGLKGFTEANAIEPVFEKNVDQW